MHERAFVSARFLSAFLLLLPLLGCSDKPGQSPPAGEGQKIDTAIVPNLSVGPVHAGMTTQELYAVLGQPQKRTPNTIEYPKLGLAVMPTAGGIVQVVMCGDVIGPDAPYAKAFSGRTPEGIGMYSTREDIVKAYGQPSDSRGKPGGMESLKYDPLGMTFSLLGDKVHHMVVVLQGKDQPQEPSINLDVVPTPAPESAPKQ